MIRRFINNIIEIWLAVIAGELVKEGRLLIDGGDYQQAKVLLAIASALNRASPNSIYKRSK